MSDKLIDKRPGQIRVDNIVFTDFDLTPYEFMVYAALCFHANNATREAYPGLTRLCKETKMSKPKVIECIKTLEEKQLISVERSVDPDNEKRKKGNRYFINNPHEVVNHVYQGSKPHLLPPSKPRLPELTLSSEQSLNNHIADEKLSAVNSKKKETVPAAKMNPMKDAIVAAFGWQTETVANWGAINKTAKELCSAGYTPDNVAGIYAHVKALPYIKDFTPAALSKYAADWKSKQNNNGQRMSLFDEAVEEQRARLAAMQGGQG